jgi:hypothetical protein
MTRLFPLLLISSALWGQKYPIHFSPRVVEGEKFKVTVTGNATGKTTAGDQVINSMDYRASFDGTAEILQVDSKHQPVRIALTVSKLSKTDATGTADLLPAGTVVIVDGAKEPGFERKDGPLDEPALEVIKLLFSAKKPEEAGDDDIFGPKEPKAVGDQWSMNVAGAIDSLKDKGLVVVEGHMSGGASLAGIDKFDGVACENIHAQLKADSFAPKEIPPGAQMGQSSIQATFNGCFPMQESMHSFKDSMEMTVRLNMIAPGGINVEANMQNKKEAAWVSVKK